jgi:pimeloyl-ACP methyl ester carboxylesterase
MHQEILQFLPKSTKAQRHPPLLFIHGSNGGAWMWSEHFLPHFAAKGYKAYALSLRGHGGSEGTLNSASFADYIEDVEKAAALIEGEPVLIGHSMGGLVAQHYVSRGHKAKGLVLLASVPPSGLGSSAMHMMLHAPDVLWQLGLLQSLGPKAVSPQVLHRALFSQETPPEAVAGLFTKMQAESPRASAELLSPPRLNPSLDEDRPPVLVIGGDADVFLPASAMHEIAFFWKADLEPLGAAPHGLMLDPAWREITAEKILAWLKLKKI